MESLIRTDDSVLPIVERKNLVHKEIRETNKPSKPIYSSDLSMQLCEQKEKVDVRKLTGGDYLDMLLGDEEKLDVEFITNKEKQDEEYNYGKSYDFSQLECEVFPTFNYEELDKIKLREIEEDRKLNQELLASHSLLNMVNDEFRDKEIDDLEKRMLQLSEVEDLPDETDLKVDLYPLRCDSFEFYDEPNVAKTKPMKNRSLPRKVVSRIFTGFMIMFGIKKSIKKKTKAQGLQRGLGRRFLREELIANKVDLTSKPTDDEEEEKISANFERGVGNRYLRDELFPEGSELSAFEQELERQGQFQRGTGKRFLRDEVFPEGFNLSEDEDEEDGDYEVA